MYVFHMHTNTLTPESRAPSARRIIIPFLCNLFGRAGPIPTEICAPSARCHHTIHYFYDSQSWHFFRNVCHRCATVLHREHVISFISVSFLYSRAIHEFCNRNSNTYRSTRTPGTAFPARAPRNAGTGAHTHTNGL